MQGRRLVLTARLRAYRSGPSARQPGGSRPTEQPDPLLDELGQAVGVARVQAVGRGFRGGAAVSLELRFVSGQHVLDLGEGKSAGHDPVPAWERWTA
jgi:hypothetical protein